MVARAHAISDPTDADPIYREGLHASISTALDYAFEAIERGEEAAPPLPPALLAQARMAARSGIGLDTVLRRYFAGYSLLTELILAEAGDGEAAGAPHRRRLLRGYAATFDRLLVAVADEYRRESNSRLGSREQRRCKRVERMLDGEPIDASDFDYDFDGHHLGVVATGGPDASCAVRELARRIDCRLLLIRRDEATAWAWLGSRSPLAPSDVQSTLRVPRRDRLHVAVGEPDRELTGWRLTHRQAAAALPVAIRGSKPLVRYGDVALLASILRDDLLATSLRKTYLRPLERERDGGKSLRETLRVYFAAGRSLSSAAHRLGVSRRTVSNRIGKVEALTGRPLRSVLADFETALRLDDLLSGGSEVTQQSASSQPGKSAEVD